MVIFFIPWHVVSSVKLNVIDRLMFAPPFPVDTVLFLIIPSIIML